MYSNSHSSDYPARFKSIMEIPYYASLGNSSVTDGAPMSEPEYSSTREWADSSCLHQGGVVSVFDVAKYILKKVAEPCSTMKLHKLLYYCQAWSMVWNERPLFEQPIEAWANGPVVRQLFNYHRGMFQIDYNRLTVGNENVLSPSQKGDVDEVLRFYGSRSPQWLIDQTHVEAPWKDARKGLASNERGNVVIPLEAMQSYYSSLL